MNHHRSTFFLLCLATLGPQGIVPLAADPPRASAALVPKSRGATGTTGDQGQNGKKKEGPEPPRNPTIFKMFGQKGEKLEFRARLKLASRALDEWTKRFEEYGSISMSAPLLAPGQEKFNFDLNRTGKEYFESAKADVQGRSFADMAIIQQLSGGAAVQADLSVPGALIPTRASSDPLPAPTAPAPTAPAAAATTPAAGTGTATSAATTPAAAPPPHSSIAPKLEFSADQKAFLDAVAGPKNIGEGLQLSDRTALVEAAGNHTVQAIFNLLGQPEKVAGFKDKRVLFATVTVGVNPGWRTRKDFSAEITTQVSFRYQKARSDVIQNVLKRIDSEGDNSMLDQILANHELSELKPKAKPTDAPKTPAIAQAEAEVKAASAALDKALQEKQTAEGQIKSLETQLQAGQAEALRGATTLEQQTENPSPELKKKLEDTFKNFAPEVLKVAPKVAQYSRPWLEKITPADAPAQLRDMAEGLQREQGELATIHERAKVPLQSSPVPGAAEFSARTEEVNQISRRLAQWKTAIPILAGRAREEEKSVFASQEKLKQAQGIEGPVRGFGSGGGGGRAGKLRVWKNMKFDDPRLRVAAPLVAGVSPLMETQVLDLQDAYRKQEQFALSLALTLKAAGRGGQADVFERFIKQQRKEAATRTSTPVVNTFSASGGLFGFQVGPRLQALEDPARRRGGSANILDRQSFPALIIVGLEDADLSPVICKDYDDKLYVFEPTLILRQTSRWNPLDRKLFSLSKNDWWYPLDWHNPRYNERDRLNDVLHINDQFEELDQWLRKENEWYTGKLNKNGNGATQVPEIHAYQSIVNTLQQRRDALATLVSGSESQQYLPVSYVAPEKEKSAAKPIQITRVFPSELTVTTGLTGLEPIDQPKELVLYTQGLPKEAAVRLEVLLDGQAKIGNEKPNEDGSIFVKLTPASPGSAVALKMIATIKDPEDDTKTIEVPAISPPIAIKKIPLLGVASEKLVPALRATTSKEVSKDGNGKENETVLFELNSDFQGKTGGLENILIERARESLHLNIKKVEGEPK